MEFTRDKGSASTIYTKHTIPYILEISFVFFFSLSLGINNVAQYSSSSNRQQDKHTQYKAQNTQNYQYYRNAVKFSTKVQLKTSEKFSCCRKISRDFASPPGRGRRTSPIGGGKPRPWQRGGRGVSIGVGRRRRRAPAAIIRRLTDRPTNRRRGHPSITPAPAR